MTIRDEHGQSLWLAKATPRAWLERCPVAIGKRLLIQTPAFLYCIGEK